MFQFASAILHISLLSWDLGNQTKPYASDSGQFLEISGTTSVWTNRGVLLPFLIQTTKREDIFQVSSSSVSSNVLNKYDNLRTFSLHKSNTYCKIFQQFVRCIGFKLPAESYTKKSYFHSFTAKCIYAH